MTKLIIDYLLQSDPWVEYRTRLDLLNQSPDDKQVVIACDKMLNHEKIKSLLNELQNWPGEITNSHRNVSLLYHKLTFLADLGLTNDDRQVKEITKKIFEHISEEGLFQVKMNIPKHFGGTGEDQWAWALCDAPLLVYSLSKLGLSENMKVKNATGFLINLARENGYPCVVSKELGKFRGPGRKDDPCPYATLVMLKLISLNEDLKKSQYAKNSISSLFKMWENSRISHPYMFYMGTDFRKLKAPLFWFDILHVADTLSNFDYVTKNKHFIEMNHIIMSNKNNDGKFVPQSEWRAWKNWDFGQKKLPSAWLTFLIYRMQKRIGAIH